MTQSINSSTNQNQTNWPMLLRAKNFISEEKNTTLKIIKLISGIILFPLALLLDLSLKVLKFCFNKFSEYIKASLLKNKELPKKSLIQKIKTIWNNHYKKFKFISLAIIISSFFFLQYYYRPNVPDQNLAKIYEEKLRKILITHQSREQCINKVQESFVTGRDKINELYQQANQNQKTKPLVDENNPDIRSLTLEDIYRADKELSLNKDVAINQCNKMFFQDLSELLWSVKTNGTYFQGPFV